MLALKKIKDNTLFVIVLAYCLAGTIYALATPPMEASDEYKHYPFVQYVQRNWKLPVLDPDDPGLWLQEAAQPPLYYILMAWATLPIDTSDLTDIHQVNPHAFVGDPNQVGNKNLIIHQPEKESLPWRGSVLAIYLIRLASIVLGIGTIMFVFMLGRLLFDKRTALLGAALTAFNPMFLFVSTAVNNDSLTILLGHLGLYLLVRLWSEVSQPRTSWQRYVALGIVLGLGLLTKLSLGGLLGLAGLALAWQAWRQRRAEIFFVGGPLVLLPALLVPAAWFWRNWQLYGDLTGLRVFMAVQDIRLEPLTFSDWVGEFGTFYRTFWGLFGGVNVAAPEIFYNIYNLLAAVGAAAFLLWLWKNVDFFIRKGVWLLAGWPTLLFLLVIYWNTTTPGFQGRLIFPGLGALNLLWAVGLLHLAQKVKVRRQVAIGLPAAALLVALLLPWTTIRPAYERPKPLDNVPEEARFGPFSLQGGGGEIQLVGVEVTPEQNTEPGGRNPIEVILYWQAVEAVSKDYLSAVHLLGRNNISVGHVNRYPAMGMIPTSQWEPGQLWRDVYHVYVNEDAAAPTRLRILTTLYDGEQKEDVPAVGPDGTETTLLIVGEARLSAAESVEPEIGQTIELPLADNITFLGYELSPTSPEVGETLTIDLFWRADGRPSQDYTVFIHLIDSAGNQLAGADGPPLNGDFPTGWWREGDVVEDSHVMEISADVEPGQYTLLIGLYDPQTGQRAVRLDGQGDAIQIAMTVNGGQ